MKRPLCPHSGDLREDKSRVIFPKTDGQQEFTLPVAQRLCWLSHSLLVAAQTIDRHDHNGNIVPSTMIFSRID
jgi:hypothetical protein